MPIGNERCNFALRVRPAAGHQDDAAQLRNLQSFLHGVSKVSQKRGAFDCISALVNSPHKRIGAPLRSARNSNIELTDHTVRPCCSIESFWLIMVYVVVFHQPCGDDRLVSISQWGRERGIWTLVKQQML